MTSKSKIKGNNFEREIVAYFKNKGYNSKRAYASDGRSLGCSEKIDVQVNLNEKIFNIQCKHHRKFPIYLQIDKDMDAVVFKENRGKKYILLELDNFISLFTVK